jgi:hypothetical protein
MKHILRVALAVMIMTGLLIDPATAHVRKANTRIRVTATDTSVKPGTKVILKAKVKSRWAKCYRSRKVKLVRKGVVLTKKKTNRHGVAKFKLFPRRIARWWVVAPKKRWGKHPHRHVCRRGESNHLRIKIVN